MAGPSDSPQKPVEVRSGNVTELDDQVPPSIQDDAVMQREGVDLRSVVLGILPVRIARVEGQNRIVIQVPETVGPAAAEPVQERRLARADWPPEDDHASASPRHSRGTRR
jgi:hypothetical protein